MKSSAITKGFIFSILTVCGTVLWFVLVWTPNRRQFKEAKFSVQFLEGKIKKDIPESQIVAIQTLADSLSTALSQKQSRIYPADGMNDLVHFIQTTVKPYDMTVVTVRPKYEKLADLERDTSQAAELPATVEVKGRFSGFTRLMDDLDRLPLAFKVNTVDMYRQDADKAIVDIELQGVVFLRKAGETHGTNAGTTDAAGRKK
jgi:hypothetical protein